jgi:hypothetical protein
VEDEIVQGARNYCEDYLVDSSAKQFLLIARIPFAAR